MCYDEWVVRFFLFLFFFFVVVDVFLILWLKGHGRSEGERVRLFCTRSRFNQSTLCNQTTILVSLVLCLISFYYSFLLFLFFHLFSSFSFILFSFIPASFLFFQQQAYVESIFKMADDFVQFSQKMREKFPNLPRFLHAHSMGGAIGIWSAYKSYTLEKSWDSLYTAVYLEAPLIKLHPASIFLYFLSFFFCSV